MATMDICDLKKKTYQVEILWCSLRIMEEELRTLPCLSYEVVNRNISSHAGMITTWLECLLWFLPQSAWHITISGQLCATVREMIDFKINKETSSSCTVGLKLSINAWFSQGNKYFPPSHSYLLKILALSVIFLKSSSFTLLSVDTAQREYDCLRIWTGGRAASELIHH